VHQVRQRLGEQLAEEAPVEADVVGTVPDSSIPAAIGYASRSGIPYNDGFIKNRYIGRTFIRTDGFICARWRDAQIQTSSSRMCSTGAWC
jgi:amidophosphoribosyltransferase